MIPYENAITICFWEDIMAAKCEVFMNYRKKHHRHLQKKKKNMTAKEEYLRDHRCKGTEWLTNIKY